MEKNIGFILKASVEDLLMSQPDILDSTDQTTMTEWNIAHHYSNSIYKFLFWYDYDNDVVKGYCNNKRPDIIFHKRQSNFNNFLVIELKKADEINEDDGLKIKEYWFKRKLNYQYGACVSILRKTNYKICVFGNISNKTIQIDNSSENRYIYRYNKNMSINRINIRERMKQNTRIEDDEIKKIIHKYYSI
jgi:hypothetical protein